MKISSCLILYPTWQAKLSNRFEELWLHDYWSVYNRIQISLQEKFTEPPYILATAEHMSTGVKHDAATVWIEDSSIRSFRICLRELQDFDGLHDNIRVVRMKPN